MELVPSTAASRKEGEEEYKVTEEAMPPTLSVREAAQILGIGRTLAYDLAQRGEFPGLLRIGERRLRVSRVALDHYLEHGSVE